jgi:hypothetical protein
MKYIITESQFDIFFKRRLGRIDSIIDSSFVQLMKIYKCESKFDDIFGMLCDDVLDRTWDEAHRNREVSIWEMYEEMLDTYLQIKKNIYMKKYMSNCKKL